jgi:4-carboxymuconolactone decarboxylase
MKLMLTASLAITALAQTPQLPSDIDPQSYSRLPLVSRASLLGTEQRDALAVYDAVNGKDAQGNPRPTPAMGPAATSMYSFGVAGPMDQLNKYVRVIKAGPAMYQLCSIIAARAYDEPYEWNSHEPGARRAGVSEAAINAVKFGLPLDGVPEKEALVIRFGRALLQDHKVPSDLYAQVVKTFGREGMFELTAAIGDYVMAAIMLRAVDQHVPNLAAPLPALPGGAANPQ